jgi:hypothetical protein
VSFAAITLCIASQRVFIVVDFVIESVRKLYTFPPLLHFWPYFVTETLKSHSGFIVRSLHIDFDVSYTEVSQRFLDKDHLMISKVLTLLFVITAGVSKPYLFRSSHDFGKPRLKVWTVVVVMKHFGHTWICVCVCGHL